MRSRQIVNDRGLQCSQAPYALYSWVQELPGSPSVKGRAQPHVADSLAT